MSVFEFWNRAIRRLRWHHISCIKLSVLFFTLLIAKYWPVLLDAHWSLYVAGTIIAALPPLYQAYLVQDDS